MGHAVSNCITCTVSNEVKQGGCVVFPLLFSIYTDSLRRVRFTMSHGWAFPWSTGICGQYYITISEYTYGFRTLAVHLQLDDFMLISLEYVVYNICVCVWTYVSMYVLFHTHIVVHRYIIKILLLLFYH